MSSLTRSLAATVLLTLLLACDDKPEQSSAEALAAALRANTNTPEPAISCISNLAAAELSDRAINLLIASMQNREEAVQALRETMPIAELTQAGMFMVSAGGRCGAAEDMD